MNTKFVLISGLVFMLLAVALGAFGAHAIKSILDEQHLQIWKTANEYQFYHAMGLVALGIWLERVKMTRLTTIAAGCFILGILLFSGSLYFLALTGVTKLGMVTPVGGLFFLSGWLLWIISAFKAKALN